MATSILIVKLSSLGDVLHALPAAQALRAAYPTAHLAWAVEATHAGLLEGQPWLDETIVWQRGARGGFTRFIRALRARKWDVAVDLQGLFRSGLVTWLSGARRRVGARQAREGAPIFYNQLITLADGEHHAVERALEVVAPLGAEHPLTPVERPYLVGQPPLVVPGRGPRLFPLASTIEDRAAVDRWCRQQHVDPGREQLVLLNPHCRRSANAWPAESFVLLARRLVERPGVRVALTAGPAARALCDDIARGVGPKLLRADGQFRLLAAVELFRRAAALVTPDTGPMHLAAAVDLPIVALLGATSSVRTGPYTSDAVVVRKPLDCAPCLAKHCRLKHDPPLCMARIEVDEVARHVEQRLEATRHRWPRVAA